MMGRVDVTVLHQAAKNLWVRRAGAEEAEGRGNVDSVPPAQSQWWLGRSLGKVHSWSQASSSPHFAFLRPDTASAPLRMRRKGAKAGGEKRSGCRREGKEEMAQQLHEEGKAGPAQVPAVMLSTN